MTLCHTILKIRTIDEKLESYRLELEDMHHVTTARRVRININYDALLHDRERLLTQLQLLQTK